MKTHSEWIIYFLSPIVLIQFLLLQPFLDPYKTLKIVAVCMIHVILLASSSFESLFFTEFNIDSLRPGEKPWLGCLALLLINLVLLTSFWSNLLTRWSIPCLHFNQNKKSFCIYRWIPITIFVGLTVLGSVITITNGSPIGSILVRLCPFLCYLWFGVGNYFVMRLRLSLFCVFLPTIYISTINWILSNEASVRISSSAVESTIILVLMNFSIVLANLAFDKSKCILDLYPMIFQVNPAITLNNLTSYTSQLLRGFLTSETNLPSDILDDFKACITVMGRNSLQRMLKLFPSGTQIDLIIIYSYLRVTDGMIDDPTVNQDQRMERLQIIERHFNKSLSESNPNKFAQVDWSYFQEHLNDQQLRTFRAISRISYYLPSKAFEAILRSFRWDAEEKVYHNEGEAVEFCRAIGGGFLSLYIQTIRFKSGYLFNESEKQQDIVFELAEELGIAYQLIDNAVDIVKDSKTLGRCYLPKSYLKEPDKEMDILKNRRDPGSLDPNNLKCYSERLIQLSAYHATRGIKVVECLPSLCKRLALIWTWNFVRDGAIMARHPFHDRRTLIPRKRQIWTLLGSLYLPSLYYYHGNRFKL